MMLGRRKFFGLAAGAAVGGKKVATDVLSEMTQQGGVSPSVGSLSRGLSPVGVTSGDYLSELNGRVAKMAALKAVGVPPFVREMLRSYSGHQQVNLDDINSLVSVSVSAKKRMIREKMEEVAYNDWLDGPSRSLKRELFYNEFGVSV